MGRSFIHLSAADVRQLLRSAGLRCTSCRIAVIQQLAAASSPQSHAELADLLTPAGFDKSTIYRSLVELSDTGLVARLDLGDHVWRFELRKGKSGAGEDHPHFMCIDCGKVTCLPEASVKIATQKGKKPLLGDVTEILLKGHCENCQ